MSEGTFSNLFHATIGGTPLPPALADLLIEAWVDLGAGVPGAFEMSFRDPYKLVLKEFGIRIGAPVVLSAITGGTRKQPLLTGEVTGLETDYDGTGTITQVRGYDPGHRLLRGRHTAGFRNMKASQIVEQVVKGSGVTAGRIEPTTTTYEFVTQPNITDWDFLSWLADENEMVLSLSNKGKLQFKRQKPAAGAPSTAATAERSRLVLQGGVNVMRCRAAVTAADQVTSVEVRGWDVTTKQAVIGRDNADTNPAVTIGTTPKKAAEPFNKAELVGTDTPYDKQSEVNTAARSLGDDVTSAFSELEVIVRGNPELRPGRPVVLTDVGAPFEGKYTVTSARHVFPAGGRYETWVTVSGRQWRSLYGLASGAASAALPRLPGVANAVVTDVQDPLKQGRVKLKFPWLDDKYTSDWVRTVQFGGVRGGGVIGPDVNDEVLVAFDRGALDHPYVIGGLYNGVDKPHKSDVPLYNARSGKVSRRTLADRDNNRIDLLDQRTGGRKRGVRLSTGDDRLTVELDRTRTRVTVHSDGSVVIEGTRSVDIKAGRDLSLTAGGQLSLKSTGAINLQGSAVNVRAAGAVAVNAGAAVSVQATAAVTLRGATIPLWGVVTANGKPVI